jgi:hypothetical protein
MIAGPPSASSIYSTQQFDTPSINIPKIIFRKFTGDKLVTIAEEDDDNREAVKNRVKTLMRDQKLTPFSTLCQPLCVEECFDAVLQSEMNSLIFQPQDAVEVSEKLMEAISRCKERSFLHEASIN